MASMQNQLTLLLILGTVASFLGLFILLGTNGAATKYLEQAGIATV